MPDFPIPVEWLTGTGFLTAIAVLYYMLLTGRLATGRELAEKNEEIQQNRDSIRELLSQNSILIQEHAADNQALEAFRRAAESAGS